MRSDSRRSTIPFGLIALAALAGTAPAVAEEAAPDEEGFVSLFNGKDLSGWHLGAETLEGKTETSDHRFVAQDGRIAIQGGPKIEDLYTVRPFDRDFVLRLEFRAGPRANSGLYLRGKQLQVRDYATIGPYKSLKHFREGDWNAIEVTVTSGPPGSGSGPVAACTCNGEVLEKALPIPPSGGIGLQSEAGRLDYRRIRIRERPASP